MKVNKIIVDKIPKNCRQCPFVENKEALFVNCSLRLNNYFQKNKLCEECPLSTED